MNFSRQFFDIKKNYAIVAWFGRAYLMSMDEDGNQCHKPIEDVKVGDRLLAYDEETGEQAYKPVKQLFRNTTEKWCTASVLVGSVITEIVSTPGHKYYLPENSVCREVNEVQEHESYYGLSEKWVSAQNLKKGDKVLLSDGNYGIIVSVKLEELANPETTYNFEVEDFHTYFVGENSVCVHNNGCQTPDTAPENFTKLKNGQGWRDKDGNVWKKDMLHKDHWDVSNKKGIKIKEIDFNGNQIWPGGPKNKNKW